jgi:HEAT repeat protein
MRLPRGAFAAVLVVGALDVAATAHAWLPVAERLALVAIIGCVLGALALVISTVPARAPATAFLLGAALAAANWAMPARWYPSVHAALAVGAVALIALPASPRPSRRRRLAGAAGLALVAAALLRVSMNLRFVACAQAPATGAVLSLATLPVPEAAIGHPRTPARGDGLALGDAHVVLITVDAMRADAALPPLSGLRFTHAYAQAPHTARSIASLLTGGTLGETLAETLRARRWLTAAWYPAGLFFDGRAELERFARTRFGFEWADTRTLDAHALTDSVLLRVDELQRRGEPRAFLWAHYFDAHAPYRAPGATPRERQAAAIAHIDAEIARLVDGLRALRRPVIIAVTADHGEEFGEHGGAYHGSSLYDEQLRVPLVVIAPGLASRTVDDPVELAALAPTLASLAGLPPSGPTLLAPPGDVYASLRDQQMLLRDGWKLIHEPRRDLDELYDLASDPGETRNLADARPDVRAALHAALDAWFGATPPSALAQTLADAQSPTEKRAAAARELGRLEAYDQQPSLRAALADADPTVRAEAALALAQLTDGRAREPLAALLDEPRWRHRAAVMLGRLRDPRAARALVDALRDVDPTLRRQAAHYLGFVGDGGSVEPLVAAAADPRVRAEAWLALGRICARAPSPHIARFLVGQLSREPAADARAALERALALVLLPLAPHDIHPL